MFASSISNRKLHCCLVLLILFILVFLSIPLFLISLANSRYEKSQSQLPATTSTSTSTTAMAPSTSGTTTTNIGGRLATLSTADKTTPGGNDTATTPSSSTGNSSIPRLIVVPTTSFSADNQPPTLEEQLQQLERQQQQQQQLQPSSQSSALPPSIVLTCRQYADWANLSLANENGYCPIGTFACQSCPDICLEQRRNCDGVADCPDRSDEYSASCRAIYQNIVNAARNRQQQHDQQQSSSHLVAASSLAKPETCDIQLFVKNQCPCVYTDRQVIICERLNLTRVPNTFLSSVYKIRMSNNSIRDIENVFWPKSLATLVLVNNSIARITNSTFRLAPNLAKLYLDSNSISHIESGAFRPTPIMSWLQINKNQLETFDSRILAHTPLITHLYLTENRIQLPEDTSFSHCQSLKELCLDHNRISYVRAHWFSNMSSLSWLSLTYNEISYIEDGAFDWNYDLEELNLSFNKIKTINRQTFAHSLNIERLYLGGNPLDPLPVDAFREIVHLASLNLSHVEFYYINQGTFSYLTQLDFIYFAKFRYCHYAPHVKVCKPTYDGLSSDRELLALPILKYAVRIVASVCLIGNVFVFIWRSVSSHEDKTLSLFVRNLAIADLMMGIYLAAIGYQDWYFKHNFGAHLFEWMSSWKCTAIGILALLSSELSVFILTIITIERYRSIILMKDPEPEDRARRARILVALAWVLSFTIAIYPVIKWLVTKNSDYYATNGLCLPLHIDLPYTQGWQYSALVYVGINFSAVMLIMVLYMHMYNRVMETREVSRPTCSKSEDRREDAILAIRFFFIVVTDCVCWIPIVVIKLMALANVSISYSIYGWLVVFIIPINSALNPIVYTMAAPTSLRSTVCRLFEQICLMSDGLWTPKKSTGARNSGNHSSLSSQTTNSSATSNRLLRPKTRLRCSRWLYLLGKWSLVSKMNRAIDTSGAYRKQKSSSTTCDTFESSIMSDLKVSFESATLLQQFSCVPEASSIDTDSNTAGELAALNIGAGGAVITQTRVGLAPSRPEDGGDFLDDRAAPASTSCENRGTIQGSDEHAEDDEDEDDDDDERDHGVDSEFCSKEHYRTADDHMTPEAGNVTVAEREQPIAREGADEKPRSKSKFVQPRPSTKQADNQFRLAPYDCLSTYEEADNSVSHKIIVPPYSSAPYLDSDRRRRCRHRLRADT